MNIDFNNPEDINLINKVIRDLNLEGDLPFSEALKSQDDLKKNFIEVIKDSEYDYLNNQDLDIITDKFIDILKKYKRDEN